MSSVTFYANDGMSASGFTYRQNERRFGGHFCAARRGIRLGTEYVLTSRSGNRVRLIVADHIGHGSDFDIPPQIAYKLMGKRWRVVGRIECKAHQVGWREVCKGKHKHGK